MQETTIQADVKQGTKETKQAKQKLLMRFPRVQLRVRYWPKRAMFFITYTFNKKQHHETLLSVPKNDKLAFKQALERCEELARKRDLELSQPNGAMHLTFRRASFLEFFRTVESTKRDANLYRCARLKFEEFLKSQNMNDVTFGELNANLVIDFRDYLVKQAEQESVSFSTASKYYDAFRVVINEALRRELLARNPCASVKPIPKDTIEREFLTVAELKRLIATPLPHTLKCDAQILADFFLFICFTGIRPKDVKSLTWQNVQTDAHGNVFVSFFQSKTKSKVNRAHVVPLNREALRIIERQRERQISESETSLVFSGLPCHRTLNNFVAAWTRSAGISKHITLYSARHSFASNLLLTGAGLLEVSRLLGHTSLTHTQVYAHLTDLAKIEAVERLKLDAVDAVECVVD